MNRQKRSLFKLFFPAFAIFVAFQALNVAARYKARSTEIANNEIAAGRVAQIVIKRIEHIGSSLGDIAIILERAAIAGDSATAAFHDYTTKSHFFTEFASLDGIVVTTDVSRGDIDALIETLNRDTQRLEYGYAGFVPQKLAAGPQQALITMIDPMNDYAQRQIGRDILTSRLRSDFLAASQTGEMRLSAPLEVPATGLSIAAFVPFKNRVTRESGAITTVFEMSGLLQWLESDLAPLGQQVDIYDIGPSESSSRIEPRHILLGARGSNETDRNRVQPSETVRHVTLKGRNWVFHTRPEKPLTRIWAVDAMFWMAVIIGLLSWALFYRQARVSEILGNLVAKRTKSLKLSALKLERERKLAHEAATHDALTGLLNERGLVQNFGYGATSGHSPDVWAILSINLDGFKEINDTTSYQTGNNLLVFVAEFLAQFVPAGSHVARFGGDEFLVLAPVSEDRACHLADEIVRWANQPQTADGKVIRFGASIGVAFDSTGSAQLEALLADASISLSAAKSAGRGQYCIYDANMKSQTVATKTLADELRRALEEDEFEPYFQTQHAASDYAITGVEVLMRWRHPTKGILPPAAFLDVAETIGILGEIDAIALRKSVDIIAGLEAEGLFVAKLSVNVSMERLRDPELLYAIECLPKIQANLTFEILETVSIDDIDDNFKTLLGSLSDRGIGIEIDDFGSGRASVLGLTQIVPSQLKIDKALVMPLLSRPYQKGVLQSIVSMGKALNIGVTAEGVETLGHAVILREIGVDTLQGFYFCKPIPASQLADLFQRRAA